MENQRVIYATDDGGIAVIVPTEDCLATHTIEAIAAKDVPAGKAYKIVDVGDMASDRAFRGA